MATLIIIAILAGALYVIIGVITAAANTKPPLDDIKTLAFWTFVICLAGAVFHKIL